MCSKTYIYLKVLEIEDEHVETDKGRHYRAVHAEQFSQLQTIVTKSKGLV